MIRNVNEFLESHWNYFISIENEFIELEKIIPIDSVNKNTFSLNYLKLLFTICSEFDVLFKEVLKFNEYEGRPKDWSIITYKDFINERCPNFLNEIILYKNDNECCPFEDWVNSNELNWWKVYNRCKHHRVEEYDNLINYKWANQENVLLAFAALFQLEMYFFADITKSNPIDYELRVPYPPSKIFKIKNWRHNRVFVTDTLLLE